MTAITLEGTGARIAFASSGFSSDLIALERGARQRIALETTHLATTGAKTYKPGKVVDAEEITAYFDHDPNADYLVSRRPQQVTLEVLLDDGTYSPITMTCFITTQGAEEMKIDQRMVTKLTMLRITNDDGEWDSPVAVVPVVSDGVPFSWYLDGYTEVA